MRQPPIRIRTFILGIVLVLLLAPTLDRLVGIAKLAVRTEMGNRRHGSRGKLRKDDTAIARERSASASFGCWAAYSAKPRYP